MCLKNDFQKKKRVFYACKKKKKYIDKNNDIFTQKF